MLEGDTRGFGICKSDMSFPSHKEEIAHLGVGVTQFDGNVTFELILESNGLNSRDGSDSGRFTVGDMSDGSYLSVSTSTRDCKRTDVDLSFSHCTDQRLMMTHSSLFRDDLV